ncbi:hypothetical protein [Ligilactobacillus agilis]|nr:hypothetical protein [Ligilactobacillus agilis]
MMASESLVQSEDSAKLQKQTPPVTKRHKRVKDRKVTWELA